MAFSNLEDRLDVARYESYLSVMDDLKDPFKTAFSYALDMACVLDTNQLREEYALFGGYGVLTHIVDRFGEKIIPIWRGSNDVDMLGTIKALTALKSFYLFKSDLPSPNLENKRTLIIQGETGDYKLDFCVTSSEDLSAKEERSIWGVPVSVISPVCLIGNKILLAKDESKQKEDVLQLLGILEYRGMRIPEFVKDLNAEKRTSLYDLLMNVSPAGNRVNIGASEDYTKSLKVYLRKLISR